MNQEQPENVDLSSSSPVPAIRKTNRPFSRWLSRLFMLAGLIWIGWLIAQEWQLLWVQLMETNWRWLLISLVMGSIAILPSAIVFYLLMREQPGLNQVSLLYVTRLMFIGQLVRHLPGRFWGVVYQVNTTRQYISPLTIVKVNLDFTLIYLAFNILFPAAILFFYYLNLFLALAFFGVTIALLTIGLHLNWMWMGLAAIQHWIPHRFSDTVQKYLSVQSGVYSWHSLGQIWLLLLFSWSCYLLAWQTFTNLFPLLFGVDMWLLCATYSIAWAVGFLSIITPDGLGVREAAFVFLGGTLTTPANMALLAVFVRVWLLVIDLCLFLLVLPFKGSIVDEATR